MDVERDERQGGSSRQGCRAARKSMDDDTLLQKRMLDVADDRAAA